MAGDTVNWILTFLVGLGGVLLLAIAVRWLARGVRTIAAAFYCPWAERAVSVRFLSLDGQRAVSVMACTAFANQMAVTCAVPCLAWGVRERMPR